MKDCYWKLDGRMYKAQVDGDVAIGFGIGGGHDDCQGPIKVIDWGAGLFMCAGCGNGGTNPQRWTEINPDVPNELAICSRKDATEVVYGTEVTT